MTSTYSKIWKDVFRDAGTITQEQAVPVFEEMDRLVLEMISSISNSKVVLSALSDLVWSTGGSLSHGKTIFERVAVAKSEAPAKQKNAKKLLIKPALADLFWHKSKIDDEAISFLRNMMCFAASVSRGDRFQKEDFKNLKLMRVSYETTIRAFLKLTAHYPTDCLNVVRFESNFESIQNPELQEIVSNRIYALRSRIWQTEHVVGLSSSDGLYGLVLRLRDLWKTYEYLRDKICVPYLRVVFEEAKKRSNSDIQTLENFQNGALALLGSAIGKYSVKRGVFPSYARIWARQGTLAGLKEEANFVKLPPAVWQLSAKINEAASLISTRSADGQASIEQIAEHLKIEPERILYVQELIKSTSMLSIDYESGDDPDAQSLHDTVEDKSSQDLPPNVDAFLMSLDPKERKYLLLNFGLFDQMDGELPKDASVLAVERLRQRIAFKVKHA